MIYQLIKLLPVCLPLCIFWLTGIAGLDYGDHWDEPKLLESVRTSVYEGVYLPTFYNYPSMSHTLGVIAALPEIVRNIDRNHLNEPVFHGHIAAYQLDNHTVTLRTRLVFLALTSLSIMWLYLFMLTWRGSVWLALVTASILAFSWEVAYHARWIAPDSILMQFGALFLLCIVNAWRYPASSWGWGAVIVAGLATGTKYPAGLLLVPALLLVYQQTRSYRIIPKAVSLFAITYVLSTPGTLLQPFRFWYDVEYEMWHYSVGHSQHTVNAGLEHFAKNLEYLATVQLSPNAVIALCLFSFALVGIVTLWRESRQQAVILLAFPVAYLLFMSLQRAMLIRNLLILVPFIAICIGLGIERINQFPRGRWLTISTMVLMLTFNGGWLIYTANTITHRTDTTYLDDLRAWVRQFPDVTYYATHQVRDALDNNIPANIVTTPQDADEILIFASEAQSTTRLPVNTPRFIIWQFGSWEVNIEYYTWQGDDRILLIPAGRIPIDA